MKKCLISAIIVCLIIIILSNCKKDKDIINDTSITGTVLNLCTGNGIKNIPVELIGNEVTLTTMSDSSGSFSFHNVSVHSSSEYNYQLYIESKSGIGNVGLIGDVVDIDKKSISNNYVLQVVPTFNILTVKVTPSYTFIPPDTVTLTFTQEKYHEYVPNYPYQLVVTSYGLKPGYPDSSKTHFDYFPMGLWNIKIDKTKNSVRTIIYDSIYIDYGATANYTFSF
ncbi:MAG: hypothetical protein JST67_03790 [Bacteroidetes bacterium]|nr:hypothetical protein [Bacteroidota bacterium]